MKRISLLALALVVLASCSKSAAPQTKDENTGEPIAFEAGQEVTLTIGTGIDSGTSTRTGDSPKAISEAYGTICLESGSITYWDDGGEGAVPATGASGALTGSSCNSTDTRVSGTLDTSTGAVNLTWEEGDQIKVTVDGKSSVFTLTGTAGSSSATFKGNMPAAGTNFSVQYPSTDTAPDLSTQSYVANGVPADKLQFKASNCTLGSSFNLKAQQSVLRLNFYGTNITLDSIVVTNTTASPNVKYKLDGCASAGAIGAESSGATSFLIVVPAGSYSFSSEVFTASAGSSSLLARPADALSGVFTVGVTPSTKVFTTSGAKTFTAGNVLNMSAKQVTEGALTKVYFSEGNLRATYNSSTSSYSWGFAANQYDYIGSAAGNTTIGSQSNGAVVDLFGWSTSSTNYGIKTSTSKSDYSGEFKDWGKIESLPGNSSSQQIWRTLSGGSGGEWAYLLNTSGSSSSGRTDANRFAKAMVENVTGLIIFPDGYNNGEVISTTTGIASINSTNATFPTTSVTNWSSMESAGCVFLPAAGYRYGSSVDGVGSYGRYWSSTPRGSDSAYFLNFFSSNVLPADNSYRRSGVSVRLVSAAQ